VLSGKPLVQMGTGIVVHGPGCVQLESAAEVSEVALDIENNNFTLAAEVDCIALVRKFYATTFLGKVSDPVNTPEVMDHRNVCDVANALLEFLAQIKLAQCNFSCIHEEKGKKIKI
jgi:hypothetical protein